MKAVSEGIINFFNANSSGDFYSAISGRMRQGRAPSTFASPYCVFFQVSHTPEYFVDEGQDQLEYLSYQFSIFSNSADPTEALNIADYAMALWDDAAITVTGYTVLRFERVNGGLLQPEGDDGEIWQHYYIEYEITIEKN